MVSTQINFNQLDKGYFPLFTSGEFMRTIKGFNRLTPIGTVSDSRPRYLDEDYSTTLLQELQRRSINPGVFVVLHYKNNEIFSVTKGVDYELFKDHFEKIGLLF
jgi:hypothetical protein